MYSRFLSPNRPFIRELNFMQHLKESRAHQHCQSHFRIKGNENSFKKVAIGSQRIINTILFAVVGIFSFFLYTVLQLIVWTINATKEHLGPQTKAKKDFDLNLTPWFLTKFRHQIEMTREAVICPFILEQMCANWWRNVRAFGSFDIIQPRDVMNHIIFTVQFWK